MTFCSDLWISRLPLTRIVPPRGLRDDALLAIDIGFQSRLFLFGGDVPAVDDPQYRP